MAKKVESTAVQDVTKINAALRRIDTAYAKIGKAYMQVCGDVAYLAESRAWEVTGHQNLYELCAERYGMSRGTVHNLVSIYKRFAVDGKIPAEVAEKPVTALLGQIKEEKAEARAERVKPPKEAFDTVREDSKGSEQERDTSVDGLERFNIEFSFPQGVSAGDALNRLQALAMEIQKVCAKTACVCNLDVSITKLV